MCHSSALVPVQAAGQAEHGWAGQPGKGNA